MSAPPPPRPPQPPDSAHDDKPACPHSPDSAVPDRGLVSIDISSDSKADQSFEASRHDSLQLPHQDGHIRPASPDTLSELSAEEYAPLRTGRSPSGTRPRNASQSPAPPRGWRGKIKDAWVRNKGVMMVVLAQVFGTLMNVLTRMLELEGNNGKGMHPFQVLFARMSITVALSSLYMWKVKTPYFPFGPKGVRLLLVARGLGGFFGVFGMYYSLLYLPLADATVITFLAPSLACWACYYILKEPFTRLEQIAALVSLFGVVLIARPTTLFSLASGGGEAPETSGAGDVAGSLGNGANATIPAVDSDPYSMAHVTPAERAMGVGVAMIGVFGSSVAYTTIRWIGKAAHPLISVNYFATWCTIVSMSVMLFAPNVGFLFPANLREWGLLVSLGLSGFVMQYLLAAGLAYEKSSRATNMVYTQMLFALAFDKLVFDTTPGILSIAGSSLILGSALYVAMAKAKASAGESEQRSAADEEQGLGDSVELDGVESGEESRGRQRPWQEVQARTIRN